MQVEFWTQHLTAMIRSVQSKVKKALSFQKEDAFFLAFAKWFQVYAKVASDKVGVIGTWCHSVLRIFRQEAECSFSDAEQLLETTKGKYKCFFPGKKSA